MSLGTSRERGVDADGAIKNLMQGANAPTGYPGDRAIRDPLRVTIQVHMLTLRAETEDGRRGGPILVDRVPVIAVSIPENLRADSLIEDDDD